LKEEVKDLIKEARAKAGEDAKRKEKIEIAKNVIRKWADNQFVADITGLNLEQIKMLRIEMNR